MSDVPRRRSAALRLAVPAAGAVALWLAASPAASASVGALTRDDGDQPGKGLTILETVGLFVGIPLLVAVILTVLTFAASGARGPRYRPGLTWWAEPVWIGGPTTAGEDISRTARSLSAPVDLAAEPVGHGQLTGDDTASVATGLDAATTVGPATTEATGGARARW